MNEELKQKIEELIKNINDIEECILYSNFDLMNKYVELFLTNYTKALLDINSYVLSSGSEDESSYWIGAPNMILEAVKSQDAFLIMDTLCYEFKERLVSLG